MPQTRYEGLLRQHEDQLGALREKYHAVSATVVALEQQLPQAVASGVFADFFFRTVLISPPHIFVNSGISSHWNSRTQFNPVQHCSPFFLQVVCFLVWSLKGGGHRFACLCAFTFLPFFIFLLLSVWKCV